MLRTRPWRVGLVMMVILSQGACYTWQPATLSPREVIGEDQPPAIRVTSTSGAIMVIPNPVVSNDSLVSVGEQCPPGVIAVDGVTCTGAIGLPLSGVRGIELRQISTARTVVALAVAGVLVLGIANALFGSEPEAMYECRDAGALGTVCGYYTR